MESYEQCGQGRNYCSLCTLDTIHKLFFVTRLIINKINKVQWVDFKLENVIVSLHSLKTMGLAPFGASVPLFLRNGELLGHSPIHKHPRPCFQHLDRYAVSAHNLHGFRCSSSLNTSISVGSYKEIIFTTQ